MTVRKRFGQHFLEPAWAARLVTVISPAADDTFIEIGPGRGVLTLPLADRVRHVTAIEIDRDLASYLESRLPSNVRLLVADVLDVDLSALVPQDVRGFRVAGNLPYNISTPILGRLLSLAERDGRLTDATLMLQREVADRLAASPGTRDYGALSVAAQRQAQITRLMELPPGAFRPQPQVHSAVIALTFRSGNEVIRVPGIFNSLVRAVFTQRRKRVSNALRSLASGMGADALLVLDQAGIDSGRRPETLSVMEFVTLAHVLEASRRQTPSA